MVIVACLGWRRRLRTDPHPQRKNFEAFRRRIAARDQRLLASESDATAQTRTGRHPRALFSASSSARHAGPLESGESLYSSRAISIGRHSASAESVGHGRIASIQVAHSSGGRSGLKSPSESRSVSNGLANQQFEDDGGLCRGMNSGFSWWRHLSITNFSLSQFARCLNLHFARVALMRAPSTATAVLGGEMFWAAGETGAFLIRGSELSRDRVDKLSWEIWSGFENF